MLIPSGARHGTVPARASKSHSHRLLILAALGTRECFVDLGGAYSRDTDATAVCLSALGAQITRENGGYRVYPLAGKAHNKCILDCGESGASLRFILPLCGALGAQAEIRPRGRLGVRPIAALEETLTAHGMEIRHENGVIHTSGRLTPGEYTLDAGVSSQYVSALLMTLPRLDGDSTLCVTGGTGSAGYIELTERVLRDAGLSFKKDERIYTLPGGQRPVLARQVYAEGDWSGAAAFLCMGAFDPRGVTVTGLDALSAQPDRAVITHLRRFGAAVDVSTRGVTVKAGAYLRGADIDAAPAPDLVPVLAALASCAEGETRIYNAARLRQKESDRLAATACLINSLGGRVEEREDELVILGVPELPGGAASSANDHRIAMATAVCACKSADNIELDNADCVAKSYADFWSDFDRLEPGGERV